MESRLTPEEESERQSSDTLISKIMKTLKEWWMSRYKVVDITFSLSFSMLYIRFIILDYGVRFGIELPFTLENLNLLNLLTKGILYVVLRGRTYRYVFWNIGRWKCLELSVGADWQILAFQYNWRVHTDHWGHETTVAIAGVKVQAMFNDGRHWDHEADAPWNSESRRVYVESVYYDYDTRLPLDPQPKR